MARAKNVALYTTLSNKRQDQENSLVGLLVVTNFKVSFLTNDNDQVRFCFTSRFLCLGNSSDTKFFTFSDYNLSKKLLFGAKRCNTAKHRLHLPNSGPQEAFSESKFEN